MDERALAERLITYDTSSLEGMQSAAGFVKGWLDARDVEVTGTMHNGRPVLAATVGPQDGPTIVLHGHIDVVPGRPEQFAPRVDGDRLFGRGAYDMKGAVAALLLALADLREQDRVRVRLGIVPDEEAEEEIDRGGDLLVEQGFVGDFAITGEPTDMHVGVAAKGVVAMRVRVDGRAAHGATPWLGENAILRAIDVFRAIQSLPFASRSSELFDRPSINLGRILGGDALNKVPDTCFIDVDVRHLPEQDPDAIIEEIAGIPGASVVSTFRRAPAAVDPQSPFVRALCKATASHHEGEVMSVGRDGASDAVSFLRAGIPAVEFGPLGAGHHGPEEWVSVPSLAGYRRAIVDFVNGLPGALHGDREDEPGGTQGWATIAKSGTRQARTRSAPGNGPRTQGAVRVRRTAHPRFPLRPPGRGAGAGPGTSSTRGRSRKRRSSTRAHRSTRGSTKASRTTRRSTRRASRRATKRPSKSWTRRSA